MKQLVYVFAVDEPVARWWRKPRFDGGGRVHARRAVQVDEVLLVVFGGEDRWEEEKIGARLVESEGVAERDHCNVCVRRVC